MLAGICVDGWFGFLMKKMLWFAVRFYFQLKQNNIRQTKFLTFSIQFLGTFIERETRT